MAHVHRYASLKGRCRKWVTLDDHDLDDEQESAPEGPVDEAPRGRLGQASPDPIVIHRRPLARLGDVVSF